MQALNTNPKVVQAKRVILRIKFLNLISLMFLKPRMQFYDVRHNIVEKLHMFKLMIFSSNLKEQKVKREL
jgi:hypothetical protein